MPALRGRGNATKGNRTWHRTAPRVSRELPPSESAWGNAVGGWLPAALHASFLLRYRRDWGACSKISLVVIIVNALGVAGTFLADRDLYSLCRKAFAQRGALAYARELLGRVDGKAVAETCRKNRAGTAVDVGRREGCDARLAPQGVRDVDETESQAVSRRQPNCSLVPRA